MRAMFPKARIIIYCEFFYRAEGQDVHFDPEGPRLGVDGIAALQCKNASSLIALAEADAGISPTRWQRSTFPKEFQEKIEVVHEGVDLASDSGRIRRRVSHCRAAKSSRKRTRS